MPIPKINLSHLNNKHVLALIGNVTISLISVLTISLLLRTMTKVDVGIWFFFLSINSLADALRNGFLSTGTVKFYVGTNPERANMVLGSVWVLAIIVSMALMLANICVIPFTYLIADASIVYVIKWFGITVLSSLVFNITFWILVADEDYFTMLWLRMVNSGSMIAALLVMAYLKKSSIENLLIINFLTNCLTSLVCVAGGYSRYKAISKYTRQCMAELTRFGKYSLASNLSSSLLGSSNNFIIKFTLGDAAVAIYNVPARLMEIVEVLLRTFVGTGMTAMALAYNTGNMHQFVYIFKKYAGMLTMLFIPMAIVIFFFADFAIWLLGGDKYLGTEAANIFRILMFVAILYPMDRFNGVSLDIIHQPQVNFYKVIVMLIVNVTFTFTGIYLLKSIYGAAFATPLPVTAGLAFGYYHLKKHINYHLRDVVKSGYFESKLLISTLWTKYIGAKT